MPVAEPSRWIVRWAPLIRAGGRVLDVACGSGRHLRWLAARGFEPTGVDRDAAALAGLEGIARTVIADIEAGPWPFAGERFDAVVVTNYLWRPLLPAIVDAVDAGGVLLYETFATGQQTIGRPARPEFLLSPGELLSAAQGLLVVAYEHGFDAAGPRFVQRIAACRPAAVASPEPIRYPL